MRWVCRGSGYAVNVPLKNGMTDAAYEALFKPVMEKVMQVYQPEVIVFQSGGCRCLLRAVSVAGPALLQCLTCGRLGCRG